MLLFETVSVRVQDGETCTVRINQRVGKRSDGLSRGGTYEVVHLYLCPNRFKFLFQGKNEVQNQFPPF